MKIDFHLDRGDFFWRNLWVNDFTDELELPYQKGTVQNRGSEGHLIKRAPRSMNKPNGRPRLLDPYDLA
jgi:hypothetical protein